MQAKGFVKGRPIDLAVLDYGLFKVHSTGRIIGICGFLVRTDLGEAILIDTGFPEKYATDTDAAVKEDRLYEFGEVLNCEPDNLPSAQLAKLGLTPSDITLQICTHTHIDHIGALGDFPSSPILISAAERALPRPLYWGDMRPLEWPDQDYLVVDDDVEIAPGIFVLMAPGHAPGQIAVMVDLPSGTVLLTSDAISRPTEIDEKFAGSWDEDSAIASADRLMRLASERDAFVIYGHCPKQWPVLKKAPEVYR
ncbi:MULTISPECIES: MBL fold metallo-hydrolase [unclassified Ruegeria]|uniref:N-acyl homoserine lactonase family protein n=1 Tax=unclassified Ruegeria TaxID=2625375 RepID=UPI001491A3C8|nr:MBL fold metallo-hydrolase [Ruegeria sp. HKCCD5849]NOD53488.1 MBL fold metallo-hydrolase [Ruegeria sp. HKCCD5851]NOD70034.1 MBL fold metallo-hydrolase [Ruegeria sp. HKCCD7303]